VVIFLLIYLVFSLNIFSDNIFEFKDIFLISPPKSLVGYSEDIFLNKIVPINNQRYLMVYKISRMRNNIVNDEELKKEAYKNKGVVKQETEIQIQEDHYIGIIDKNGKILIDKEISPQDDFSRIFKGNDLLVMDETDKCPYAYLDYAKKEIICFDLNLGEKKRYKIEMDDIKDFRYYFDGKNHNIYFIGKNYNEKLEKDGDFLMQKPRDFKTSCKKFILEKEKWEVVPFSLEDLNNQISKIARNPEGEKIKLDKRFIDFKVLNEYDRSNGFNLIVLASDVKESKSIFLYKGNIYFFKAYLDDYGLRKVIQLPFYITQDLINKIKIDKEKSVIYLPEYVLELCDSSEFFTFNGKDILFYLLAHVNFPDNEGKYNYEEGGDIFQYFVYFASEKDSPKIFDLYNDIIPILKKGAKEEGYYIAPMLGVLRDRLEKDEILFKSVCIDEKNKESQLRCLVKAQFNMP